MGDTAFWLSRSLANPANELSGNTFSGNNIAQLKIGLATVCLDEFAHDNVFIGQPGTVIDLGTDNVYTGMTLRRGPGSQLKDAVERRNAHLRDSHAPRLGLD